MSDEPRMTNRQHDRMMEEDEWRREFRKTLIEECRMCPEMDAYTDEALDELIDEMIRDRRAGFQGYSVGECNPSLGKKGYV